MPLPAPILDDRSYLQLRDELIRRIPVYTPEWTDHNASDPGITLIELFAFLGENLLYRFNQIPDATRLAFLRLLQIPLRPAAPARSLVTMARADTDPGALLVPAGTSLAAGSILFQSLSDVQTWPLAVTAIGRIVSAAPSTTDAQDFVAAAIDARGGLRSGEQAAYYLNQTVPPDPTAPDALAVDFQTAAGPVDFGRSVDGLLWIAVRKTTTKIVQLDKALLSIGFVPDPVLPTIDQIAACPGSASADNGSELIWQASTGHLDADGHPVYQAISAEGDTTIGLSQQGVVQLRLPINIADLGIYKFADPDLAGTGDFPPQIEDAKIAAEVIFWLRGSRRDASRPLAKVLFVGINACEVLQSVKAQPEFLGTGNADSTQKMSLVHKPVLAGSARVQVEEAAGWTDWQAVDDFTASCEDSRDYVLDAEAGTISFGDGVRGRAPQIGERVRALEYAWGGGAAGNVAAKAITKVNGFESSLKAANPLPATGGAEGEAIADAITRVPGEFRRHDRAVTPSDFQELALATPGANVGRAECLPLFDPTTKAQDAAGVVSVVIWPAEDLLHPHAPVPDRTMLRAVCTWLDARRLVTTELYVIPPTYRQVAVAVGIQAKPGYGIEAVRRWVELVIRQYLAPLPPYGPEGQGWPLGRAVYGPELEAAALQVEGVLFIQCLRLAQRNGGHWVEASTDGAAAASGCQPRERVLLQAWEVPELSEITVVQGDALAPGAVVGPAVPPLVPLVPIPIPTIPEEC
jgi:hypothetical protein